jgi:hypothetical protein
MPRFALLAVPALVATLCGCSDPVPPIPQGGFEVQFQNPGGGQCNINSHNVKMGTVNAAARSELVSDGAGASVSCSVSASSISGSAFENPNNLTIDVPSITPETTIDAPATGVVSFSSGTTAGVFVSPPEAPCNFYFQEGQTIQAGDVWVTFDCPTLTSEGQSCRILKGFAAFTNCE